MRIVASLVKVLVVLLNFIGISSGMPPKTINLLANFGKSNEDAHNQGDPTAGPYSSSDRLHPPASSFSDASHHFQIRSSSPAVPPLRQRSRSPPLTSVLGYGLDQLQFIRLITYKNPQRQFELRRYTFPADKPVQILLGQNQYGHIPSQEQIVLSKKDGDVFAILHSTNSLAGIYTYNNRTQSKGRAKINMNSGEATSLTAEEIKEIPVGIHRLLSYAYRVEHVNHSHGSLPAAEPPLGTTSNSPSKRMALPTRLPSSHGTGYGLDQLQFIRLIPNRNRSRIFELQRYTFPRDKLIFVLEGGKDYRHIEMQELIVLTTPAGDVFAILENMHNIAGIYTYNTHTYNKGRIKINMRSGLVTPLTKDELGEVPVGSLRPIRLNFTIHHINHDPPRHPVN